jgi:hypothetical protein
MVMWYRANPTGPLQFGRGYVTVKGTKLVQFRCSEQFNQYWLPKQRFEADGRVQRQRVNLEPKAAADFFFTAHAFGKECLLSER